MYVLLLTTTNTSCHTHYALQNGVMYEGVFCENTMCVDVADVYGKLAPATATIVINDGDQAFVVYVV